jgi:hypothetical protein
MRYEKQRLCHAGQISGQEGKMSSGNNTLSESYFIVSPFGKGGIGGFFE